MECSEEGLGSPQPAWHLVQAECSTPEQGEVESRSIPACCSPRILCPAPLHPEGLPLPVTNPQEKVAGAEARTMCWQEGFMSSSRCSRR